MRKISLLKRNFTELTGVIHNHSQYSYDCDVPIKSIIKAAYKNSLDYVTINDHNVIAPRDEIESALKSFAREKTYQPIVITGSELNDNNDHHHLLVYNGIIPSQDQDIESVIKEQQKLNATLFAAHPYESRVCNNFPLYIWDKTDLLQRVSGMEIWNYSSSWLSRLNPKSNGLFLLLFPNFYVRKPFSQNLRLWDRLNNKGYRISAIGSTDAHGTRHKLLFFEIKILTHHQLFKTIRTNVLIKDGVTPDENSILNALKQGNSYIINNRIGYPYNFYAGICIDGKEGVTFGEEIEYEPGLKLYYRLPKSANICLLKNGNIISWQNKAYGFFPIESSGNYRLEILRYGKGWIYTNNIYVK